MSTPLYQTLTQTAHLFIESYAKARKSEDMTDLSATCTPECRRFLAPVSLLQMLPEHFKFGETNEHYEERMRIEFETSTAGSPAEIINLVVDESARKVVVDVIMYTVSKESGKEYPFEFVFTLSMIEDGSAIKEIRQYVDTGMARKFLEENQEINEKVQSTTGDQ